MIVIAAVVGAVLAAMICRVGHGMGATNDAASNLLRIAGGTGLFAMAATIAADRMWLGVAAALLGAVFVAIGGIDILRHEMRHGAEGATPAVAGRTLARDGDTMEMPVIMRDAA